MPRLRARSAVFGDAFGQERVVPQIGMRIERHRREEDDHRLFENIGGFYRDVERGIVQSTLRALHPVDDATSSWFGDSGAAYGYAWIGGDVFQSFHRRATTFNWNTI